MTYEELIDFIENKMRMSHIYQPVMLSTMLQNKGQCSEDEIAKAILEHDQSQIDYYRQITNNMVGRVLRNHKIIQKTKGGFHLIDFENLTKQEVDRLIEICEQKLQEYIDRRGSRIWTHRVKSSGYVSGTIRYEVLKRAKFHCELCGVSADERALEVDHIVPRNRSGDDDISNFQALCYKCNAMKRDRDDTDFRKIRESFKIHNEDCLFCNIDRERLIIENEIAYSVWDGFPVTPFHALIIPKRHVVTYFDLGQSEVNACTRMINELRQHIENEDSEVMGFNIGINNGEVAGQSIFHCHIHLIPRRQGDVKNPRGGVRYIIPHKGHY